MTILSASEENYQAQALLVYQILSEVYSVSPWTKEQIEADMAQEQTDYFFVGDGERVVGFLSVQNLAGELEITHLAVLPAYQGQGYANQLMDYLDGRAPIFLEVRESNQVAQHLYRKYGFKQVGLRKHYYHEPVEHAVIMERKNEG